jgi:hypothetical protein
MLGPHTVHTNHNFTALRDFRNSSGFVKTPAHGGAIPRLQQGVSVGVGNTPPKALGTTKPVSGVQLPGMGAKLAAYTAVVQRDTLTPSTQRRS